MLVSGGKRKTKSTHSKKMHKGSGARPYAKGKGVSGGKKSKKATKSSKASKAKKSKKAPSKSKKSKKSRR